MSESETKTQEEMIREIYDDVKHVKFVVDQTKKIFTLWGFICGIVPAILITILSAIRIAINGNR